MPVLLDVTLRPARPSDAPHVLALLSSYAGLEVGFDPSEFTVAETAAGIVACARLRRYDDGAWEIASVAVRKDLQGAGIGARVVERALAPAAGAPVFALALAPGFFERLGFRAIDAAALPAGLAAKAAEMCAGTAFVPMLRG